MVTLRPDAPELREMFTLQLHESVFDALVEARAITDGYMDPAALERWADGCENPEGQRASLVRAIAQLRRISTLSVA